MTSFPQTHRCGIGSRWHHFSSRLLTRLTGKLGCCFSSACLVVRFAQETKASSCSSYMSAGFKKESLHAQELTAGSADEGGGGGGAADGGAVELVGSSEVKSSEENLGVFSASVSASILSVEMSI